ncbi:hypothetical protein [Proteiniborus sp. MB09-C3]|uniref:hypothetical protein n=1 Tax=Proteiniborus sp. MB09-C3 TaxID=3050072 RepID=UPI0025578928|nr:hypothetical protein [Proteiniborus sp. MB09-C3]WIV10645.1 hypothetical protein QO263_10795 [Proteiniborus sp. MB09-C3]
MFHLKKISYLNKNHELFNMYTFNTALMKSFSQIVFDSPIIMAYLGATIYDLNKLPMEKIDYTEIESVKFFKSFLNCPEGFFETSLDEI